MRCNKIIVTEVRHDERASTLIEVDVGGRWPCRHIRLPGKWRGRSHTYPANRWAVRKSSPFEEVKLSWKFFCERINFETCIECFRRSGQFKIRVPLVDSNHPIKGDSPIDKTSLNTSQIKVYPFGSSQQSTIILEDSSIQTLWRSRKWKIIQWVNSLTGGVKF